MGSIANYDLTTKSCTFYLREAIALIRLRIYVIVARCLNSKLYLRAPHSGFQEYLSSLCNFFRISIKVALSNPQVKGTFGAFYKRIYCLLLVVIYQEAARNVQLSLRHQLCKN